MRTHTYIHVTKVSQGTLHKLHPSYQNY